MVVDIDRCTGCSACVIDCKQKNATPKGVFWKWMESLEIGEYPAAKRVYLPMGCMHCDEPPCDTVCPTGATHIREGGIVDIDSSKCIGCKACMTACPYDARTYMDSIEGYYNMQMTPYEADGYGDFHAGTISKCNFCVDRIETGLEAGLQPGRDREATPSCVNTCPAEAIQFGDLDDPEDSIHDYVSSSRAVQLKEEVGTNPSVHYLMPGEGNR